mgnify:CR=1 FL=1
MPGDGERHHTRGGARRGVAVRAVAGSSGVRRLKQVPGVVGAAPAILGKALVVSGEQQAFISLKGIDPALEPDVTDIQRSMVDGSVGALARDADAEVPGILIGRELAQQLGPPGHPLAVGDSVTLQTPQGTLTPMGMLPRVRRLRVAGIYSLGLFEFDIFGKVGFWYTVAVLFVLFLLARRVVHSPFGLSLRAIRNNPLRASVLADPDGARKSTGDNTPAVVHVELVPGNTVEVIVAAKGGGSESKTKFAVLNPSDSVVDWVLEQVPTMGGDWCPPGMLGVGIGGTPEKAMVLAKESILDHLSMHELKARGPKSRAEELRLELFEKINALGIGAQQPQFVVHGQVFGLVAIGGLQWRQRRFVGTGQARRRDQRGVEVGQRRL